MEQSFLSAVLLPVALAVIMLGMGLGLVPDDFKRIRTYPKAVFVGLFSQVVLLPVIALGVVKIAGLDPVLGVGLMILAFSPGGATSNLITNLAKGDTALSITLTAITSVITVFTLPYGINFVSELLLGKGQYVELPILKTMLQIVLITILPVGIGMYIKSTAPGFALKADKPVRIASALFIALIILGIILKERARIIDFFVIAGGAGLLLNIGSMAAGFLMALFTQLNRFQKVTITIETGIQNGTLAIAIASGIIGNDTMSVPAAIYSLIMFFSTALLVPVFSRWLKKAD